MKCCAAAKAATEGEDLALVPDRTGRLAWFLMSLRGNDEEGPRTLGDVPISFCPWCGSGVLVPVVRDGMHVTG